MRVKIGYKLAKMFKKLFFDIFFAKIKIPNWGSANKFSHYLNRQNKTPIFVGNLTKKRHPK